VHNCTRTHPELTKYEKEIAPVKNCKLLVGVTLQTLEGRINAMLAEDESTQLVELIFAQGIGFVAAMVRDAKGLPPRETVAKRSQQARRPAKSKSKS
jgi:hypothetical protein